MFEDLLHPYPVRRNVVVTTKSDTSFRGVLWARNREFLVLKSVELLRGSDRPIPMNGEVVIERTNVDYYQVLNGVV